MGNCKKETEVSVEKLLRIKRSEKPDNGFWEKFESDFQRRRLQVLMEQENTRSTWWHTLWNRGVAVAAGACALAAAGWIGYHGYVHEDGSERTAFERVAQLPVSHETVPAETVSNVNGGAFSADEMLMASGSTRQFVMDVIQQSSGSSGAAFRKVHYTPALEASSQPGSYYVRDSFVRGDYRVTTAEARFGGNF
jgi:hypothetical protein